MLLLQDCKQDWRNTQAFKIKFAKHFSFNSDLFVSQDIRNVFLSKYYLFGLNVEEYPIQGIY